MYLGLLPIFRLVCLEVFYCYFFLIVIEMGGLFLYFGN